MNPNEKPALVPINKSAAVNIWTDPTAFEYAQRVCKVLAASTVVPEKYRNNLPDALVAYEMALRTNMSPIMVMQNLDIIKGKPSWSSKFVIAAMNSCGRFEPLEFEYGDKGEEEVSYTVTVWGEGNQKRKDTKKITIRNLTCTAFTHDKKGKRLEGPEVSIKMAVQEGWYTKDDSKWPNMPKLMLSYRAAKFFGNLYAPDVLMGMPSEDEVQDAIIVETIPAEVVQPGSNDTIDKLNQKVSDAPQETPPVGDPPQNDELM